MCLTVLTIGPSLPPLYGESHLSVACQAALAEKAAANMMAYQMTTITLSDHFSTGVLRRFKLLRE